MEIINLCIQAENIDAASFMKNILATLINSQTTVENLTSVRPRQEGSGISREQHLLLQLGCWLWQYHQSVSQQVINLKQGQDPSRPLECSSMETHIELCCYVHMTAAVCVGVMNPWWLNSGTGVCENKQHFKVKPQVVLTWALGSFCRSSFLLCCSVNHHQIVSTTGEKSWVAEIHVTPVFPPIIVQPTGTPANG